LPKINTLLWAYPLFYIGEKQSVLERENSLKLEAYMRLTNDQIQERLGETIGWERREDLISRTFNFKDFKEAMAFVNKAADIAESMDHHPDILISYNVVQLSVFTHSEGGLTNKDFKLAKKINEIS